MNQQDDMTVSREDRTRLRDLARQVRQIADLPVMADRREMWKRHNRLHRVRPLILVFPEGAWRELLPDSDLRCETDAAREIERELRRRIFYHNHINDDSVIESEWTVHKVIRNSGWGLEPRWTYSDDPTGARAFDPVILEPADLRKLRFPEITCDEDATAHNLALAHDLFDGILTVKLTGVSHISFHLVQLYSYRRGLADLLLDMAANPQMVHDAMSFFEEGSRRMLDQFVAQNLLSLNNDGTYHSSGGVGYTDELPAPGFHPDRVRPRDMWASAEAQELALVSPDMHEEFALAYEKRLLEPFGLSGYGCCEDLTRKLDLVFRIPRIRRISISPFADVDACAEKLRADYIFSWKPHPAHLVGNFDPDAVRQYIRHTLDVTRGCVIEMILKDTHTCEHHPERFTIWTQVARELAEQY